MSEYIVTHGIRIAKDFIPETFGRLTTVGPRFMLPIGKKGIKRPYQVCKCECSEVYRLVLVGSLTSGKTKSCGCYHSEQTIKSRTKHGKRYSLTYRSRDAMIQRCTNPKDKSYPDYGGRGITVHPDWLDVQMGFQNFYDDMGPRPSARHEIERKDVNGNYCPENCEWVTREQQARNKRNNKIITYEDKTQCLAAWAEETGIKRETISARLHRGWSVEKALTTQAKSL